MNMCFFSLEKRREEVAADDAPVQRAPATRATGRQTKRPRTQSAEARVVFVQPNSTGLEQPGITPVSPNFTYSFLYKFMDPHEVKIGSAMSLILTGPNLHASLQAHLRGPYFVDVVENQPDNIVQNPLRYMMFKLLGKHPIIAANTRIRHQFKKAHPIVDSDKTDDFPSIKTLENN